MVYTSNSAKTTLLLLLNCLLVLSSKELTLRLRVSMNNLCKSVVICGPSGVGKGTIINKLLRSYPSKLGLSVSRTSRLPREGEVDGVHYFFVNREELENDIRDGPIKYIEHANVHSNLYGTRQDAVEEVHAAGKVCILDLDTKGVQQIKSTNFPTKLLFLAPPSIQALESRLQNRGSESENQVRLRVSNAKDEVEYGLIEGNFDAVVVNDNLDFAYQAVLRHLREWFPFAGL